MQHHFATSQLRDFAIALVLSTTFLANAAFAGGVDKTEPVTRTDQTLITLTGGIGFSRLHNNTTVDMNGIVTNTYNTSKTTTTNPIFGLAAHRIYSIPHHMHVTVGPALYYVSYGKIKGIESPFSNGGTFDTLNYKFFAQSFAFFLESTLSCTCHGFHPFVLAGIGVAWNRLYDYSETPTDPSGSASPAIAVFRNNTESDFAYEVGAGVSRPIYFDKKLDVLYHLALQYRYINTGSGKFRPSTLQTTNDSLQVNTLDAQAILLSLSATFN